MRKARTSRKSANSKRWSKGPRRELFITDSGQLAFGFFTAGHSNDLFEYAHANLLDRFCSIKDRSSINVHVLFHPIVERAVRRDFDAGRRFAAIDAAATGGENGDVAAAGDQTGHADRIVSGCIHETKAGCVDLLRVFVNRREWRLAALGDSAQTFFVNIGQTPFPVSMGWVVIDATIVSARVFLPPVD